MNRKSKLSGLMQAAQEVRSEDSSENVQANSVDRIQNIALERIYVNPAQHRKYFAPEEQQKLQIAIRQNGFQGAVLLRHLPDNLRESTGGNFDFELVFGESRTRAVEALGWSFIPSVVKDLTNEQVHRIRLDENLVRKDLNPLEEMDGLLEVAADELGMPPAAVLSLLDEVENAVRRNIELKGDVALQSEKLQNVLDYYKKGSLSGFRTKYRKLQKLPDDIKSAVRKSLDWSKAVEIQPIRDSEERTKVLKWAIEQNPSIKEIRQKRRDIKSASNKESNSSGAGNALKEKFYEQMNKASSSEVWNNPKQQEQLLKLIADFESIFDLH